MITVSWPLHELLWYFTSLQTNILALLLIKQMPKFYIFSFYPIWLYIDIGNFKLCSLISATEPWLLDQPYDISQTQRSVIQLHYQFKKSPNFPLIVGFTVNRIKIYKLLSRIILQWQWYCFQYPRTLWRHWKITSNVWLFNADIVSSFWLQRKGCWFDWLSMLFQLFKSSSIWHHGNGFASTKLPSSELSCIYNSFCDSRRKARATTVTDKRDLLGLGDEWESWQFSWLHDGVTKIASLCIRVFGARL